MHNCRELLLLYSYCDDMFWVSFPLEILINWIRQGHYLLLRQHQGDYPSYLVRKISLITYQEHNFQLSSFVSIFIVKMPKCCFGSRSVRSYTERFMALVKQIFPQKKTGMVLIRIKADWDCSQMRQPKVLVQSC